MPTATIRALLVVVVVSCFASDAFAAEARVRIVFFTPSDVDPPENVPQRMKQVVDAGQAFYGRWMQHWGYEPEQVLPIDRDEQGRPVVYFVRGEETAASGKYDEIGYHGMIRETAIMQYGIPRDGSTWWLFVYGTNLRASRGWGGWQDRNGNGIAMLVWHDFDEPLPDDDRIAGGVADRINLKGYLHELGHTMSLPHIGPSDRHGLGMSLMGPNARSYRSARSNQEDRVYLTPAVAALIWKQPQMTGRFETELQLPKFNLRGFAARFDRRQRRFVLSGRLSSDIAAHSVVAIDLPETGLGDYWKKTYCTRLDENGAFTLPIDELEQSSGVVKVVFCFDNGVFTAKETGVGFRNALEVPYRFANGNYQTRVNP